MFHAKEGWLEIFSLLNRIELGLELGWRLLATSHKSALRQWDKVIVKWIQIGFFYNKGKIMEGM